MVLRLVVPRAAVCALGLFAASVLPCVDADVPVILGLPVYVRTLVVMFVVVGFVVRLWTRLPLVVLRFVVGLSRRNPTGITTHGPASSTPLSSADPFTLSSS